MRTARSRGLAPWWLVGACLAAVLAFALVAVAAYDVSRLGHLDARALVRISAHRDGALGDLAEPIGHLGDPVAQVLLLVAGLGVAIASGRREAAVAGLIVVLGADSTTAVLKHVLAAPRHDPLLGWEQLGADAFPSGHTTAAFSMATAWALFVPPRRRWLAVSVGAAAACAVGASMVILHHHFPSDVLGGILVVAAWTFAVLAVLQLCSFAQEDEPRSATFEA